MATTLTDGHVSLNGRLTAFVSDTTMALVEDGAQPGPREHDMGGIAAIVTAGLRNRSMVALWPYHPRGAVLHTSGRTHFDTCTGISLG